MNSNHFTLHRLQENTLCKQELINIEFDEMYDVIVVGGGTAGSISALLLADAGISVLVIEQLNCMGGIHSTMMFDYYMGSKGGYYENLDEQIKKIENEVQIVDTYGIHVFLRKYVIEQNYTKNGGIVHYNSVLTGAYMAKNNIVGIQYLQNGDLKNVQCRFVIDASGNAIISRLAGVKVSIGRESDQNCQPFSNVRIYYDKIKGRIEINNIDAGYLNQFDVYKYSKSVVRSAQNIIYSNSQHQPNSLDLAMSVMLGVRESYTVVAEKTIVLKNVIKGECEKEPLFYSLANVDIHSKDIAFESEALCDWIVGMSLWGIKVSIGIPKEAMISQEVHNLVIAGKHISMDHDVASQMRMMRDCQKSGEAAAILVEQALRHHVPPIDVEYHWMKDSLMKCGCLNIDEVVEFQDNPPLGEISIDIFPKNTAEIKQWLEGDRPGIGMLFAIRKDLRELLKEWMNSRNENLKSNSALVLGLLGEDAGKEILLNLVRNRDTYLPKTSKSYNTLRGISAVYVLGRLGVKEAVPVLLELLMNLETLKNDKIILDKLISSDEDYKFQYASHCVRALLNIAKKNEDLSDFIEAELNKIVYSDSFQVCTTLKANAIELLDMSSSLKNYIKFRLKQQKKEEKTI